VLKWNLEALNRAGAIKDDEMNAHYPSLYLNVGKSYETLGDIKQANNYYHLAADHSNYLPPGKYGDMLRMGIAEGLKRTGTTKFNNDILNNLIDKWCKKKELRPLSLTLPAYLSNLGTENDLNKLVSALSYLSATRCLNEDDQMVLDELIVKISEKQVI